MSESFSVPIVHFAAAQAKFDIPQTANPNAFLGDIYGTYVFNVYSFLVV